MYSSHAATAFPAFLTQPEFIKGGQKRKRRHWTIFTDDQIEDLEKTFQRTHYLRGDARGAGPADRTEGGACGGEFPVECSF